MSVCRSSAGCSEAAGRGTFGSFCEAHAAELAALRARWFTAEGSVRKTPADDAPPTPVEDDARAVAVEVLRAGRASRAALAATLDYAATRLDRAVRYAERAGWIAPTSHGLTAGDVIPPGRLPKQVRAAMLVRFVRDAGRVVPADEAAAAIGLARGGSFPRVVAHARDAGWVTTTNGPGGGIAAAA